MQSNGELKERAKNQLGGQWTLPVLLTLGQAVISIVLGEIEKNIEKSGGNTFALSILTTLITTVISIAFISFYIKLSRDKEMKFNDVLLDGTTLLKGIGIELMKVILQIPIAIVEMLVAGITIFFTVGTKVLSLFSEDTAIKIMNGGNVPIEIVRGVQSIFTPGIIILLILLVIILVIPFMIFNAYTFMSLYILCDDNSKGVWECISTSFRLMKGNVWRYIYMELSFIGWVILGSLPCGIGMLWVVPYMSATQANFYNEILRVNGLNVTNETTIDVINKPEE